MGNWTNLNSWFNELEKNGSNVLNDKLLSERFLKSGSQSASQQAVFQSALEVGLGVHSTQKELQNLASAMKKVGYDQVHVSGDEEHGYRVEFLPSNSEARKIIKDKNIPSIEILPSTNGGLTITNNLPAIDALHFVQNQGGDIGLARALTLGISNAARELEERAAWLEKQNLDYDKKAKLIARTIRQSMRRITHENPSATTKNQKDDFSKSISFKNVQELRREGLAAQSMQVHTSFLYKTILNRIGGLTGKGKDAPRNETAALREFDDIAHAALGFSDIKDLENYVEKVHPWFYRNVWGKNNGNLQQAFKVFYGIGASQGIKKEGAPGIISFSQPIIPGVQLAGISERKMGANLRAYSKKISNEAVQALKNFEKGGALDKGSAGKYFRFTTKQQRQLYTGSELENAAHTHKTYFSADVSSAHIAQAAEALIKEQIKEKLGRDVAGNISRADIKELEGKLDAQELKDLHYLMQDALKGVDNDASVYAQQILDDFRFAIVDRRRVSREVIEDLVTEMATKAVSKTDQYKNADAAGRQKLIQMKKDLLGSSLQKQAIRKALELDKSDQILKIEDDQEFFGDFAVTVKQKFKNPTFTTRGLTMTDFRSVSSNMQNRLFGKMLELAGYRKQDIYANGKDVSGGLNITVARGEHKMKPRDTVLSLMQLITGNLEKQGKSKTEIINAFGGLGSLVGNAGIAGYDFDDVALEALLKQGGVTNLIKKLGALAVSSGAVGGPGIKDNLFAVENGNIVWAGSKVPLPIAMGRFSGDIYQGTGPNASKMKYDQGTLLSLSSTIDEIRRMAPDANLSALEKKRDYISGRLQQLEAEYKRRYGPSAKHIGASFQGNAAKSAASLAGAGGIAMDISELAPLGLLEEVEYDTQSGRGGILINGEDGIAVLEKIKARQEEEWKNNEKKLRGMGIGSAADIPVAIYAKDANGDLIPFYTTDDKGKVNVGYHARLGATELAERYKVGDSWYIPIDEIGKSNFDIIRAMFELSAAGTDQETMRRAQKRAGERVLAASQEMLSHMEEGGSIFEKYHSFREESGGYMLAQAMNPDTRAKLYSMYGWEEGGAPSIVVGRKAMTDILSMASEEILQEQYKDLFGGNIDESILKDKKKLVKVLTDALNVDSKNYKGAINRSSALFRFPLLKMFDDFISGGLVVSDAIAEGNMLVDPDFAKVIHADFDGDRYPIFNLLMEGDYAGAAKAMKQYFADRETAQAKARIAAAKKDAKEHGPKYFASTKDMEAPLNDALEKTKIAGMNVGAKWAGISGDVLLKGTRQLANEADLDADARSLITLLGQMYQVGINIKNLKPEKLNGENVAELQNRLFGLLRKSGTWDTKEGLQNLFGIMGQLGIVDLERDGFFSEEVLANLGLDPEHRKALGTFGVKYPSVTRLINSILNLKKTLKSKGKKSFGQIVDDLYNGGFITAYQGDVLNPENQKDLDETAAKLVGIVSPEATANSIRTSAAQSVGEVLRKKHGYTTATEVKKLPFGGLNDYGPQTTFTGIEALLKKVDPNKPATVANFMAKYGSQLPLMLSTLSGNVTHNFAEGYIKNNNRAGISKKSSQYKDYVDTYAKLYTLGLISMNPAVAAAAGLEQLENGKYDPQKVAEYMVSTAGKRGVALGKLIKSEGGTVLSEAPILGAAYGKEFSGRSDVLSIKTGKDGTTFTITDFKNRKGAGDFEPEYGVQTLSYIHNLQAYAEAVQAFQQEGIKTTGDLFSSIVTESVGSGDKSKRSNLIRILQQWKNKYENFEEYGPDGKKTGKVENRLQDLYTITDAILSSGGKIKYEAQAAVLGADNRAHIYEVDLRNEIAQRILESFKDSKAPQLTEEEKNLFITQGVKDNLDKGVLLTPEDQLKYEQLQKYIEARKELVEVEQEYLNVEKQIEAFKRHPGNEADIEKLSKRKAELEEKLEGQVQWTVDKNGNPVAYRIPGKRAGVAKLREGLEDFEGINTIDEIYQTQDPDVAVYEKQAILGQLKARKSAQQQAYSAYKDLYGYESRIAKVDQALAKETDADKIAILQQEKQDLEDLHEMAQATVELLEEAHKGDENWTGEKGYLAMGRKRAELGRRAETRAENAQGADGGLLGDISGQFSNYFSRFVIGRGAMTIMAKLRQGIKLLIQNAKALDSTLTNLRIVTNGTKEDTRRLMTEYSDLGQKIGATTQEVSASALEWQRQGYQTAQIQDLVTSSLYLSKLGMIDATAATKDLTNYVINLQVC